MSILQEYEKIRKSIGEEKYNHIEQFLELNPNYLLSDVYYKEKVWDEFEQWESKEYNIPISEKKPLITLPNGEIF